MNVPAVPYDAVLRPLLHQLRRRQQLRHRRCVPIVHVPGGREPVLPGYDPSALTLGHLGGDTWVADAAIAMMDETGRACSSRSARSTRPPTCGGRKTTRRTSRRLQLDRPPGSEQTHVRCAAENADVQLGKLLDAVAAKDASDGGETLVVLTADHGATYGKNFYGKTSRVTPATTTGTSRRTACMGRSALIRLADVASTTSRRRRSSR